MKTETQQHQLKGEEPTPTAPPTQPFHSLEVIEENGGKVLQYLMNFSKPTMKDVPLSPETIIGGIVDTASKDMHAARLGTVLHIQPSQDVAPSTAEARASSSEALELIKTLGETLADSMGNGTGSAPKATKMFLEQWKALGSIDMENPLEQLDETAMQIVNARDQSDRSALLDCALAQENIDPNIAPVQVRNVCNGPLGWTSIEEPNGISSFLMEIPGIAGNRDSSMTEYVIRLRAQYNEFVKSARAQALKAGLPTSSSEN